MASINAVWAILWVLVAALAAAAGLWRRIHAAEDWVRRAEAGETPFPR